MLPPLRCLLGVWRHHWLRKHFHHNNFIKVIIRQCCGYRLLNWPPNGHLLAWWAVNKGTPSNSCTLQKAELKSTYAAPSPRRSLRCRAEKTSWPSTDSPAALTITSASAWAHEIVTNQTEEKSLFRDDGAIESQMNRKKRALGAFGGDGGGGTSRSRES